MVTPWPKSPPWPIRRCWPRLGCRLSSRTTQVTPSVQHELPSIRVIGAAQASPSQAYPDGLIHREAEVLREIARGFSNREIADRPSISEATVKTHVNNIFTKADLRDRAQAVVYAIHHGLASLLSG